ncbi:MAG: YihY family inner membrane protein [Gammaproteobacteria bacterium]|nr:YihY family inner membrane protein [Gammaproteobacteria bacterium]
MNGQIRVKLLSRLAYHKSIDFCLFVSRRLYRDHCGQISASLTYTSLLAFIPFMVVSFSILREFPIFPELVNNIQSILLQIFTPDVGLEVKKYIQMVIIKGRGLPLLSLIVLFFTAIMMLYTVDDTLNRIWQVEYRRRTWLRLLSYLLVVITGPILLGISLIITTYIISRPEIESGSTGMNWLVSVPWLVTFVVFTSVYRWVPNTHVRWLHAGIAGLLTMVLFEMAKWGFGLYIRWVPTYNILYGTLAAVPLTLIWLYLSWLVVLIGAETARCLETYQYGVDEADLTARQLLGFFHRTRDGQATVDQIASWAYLGRERVLRILRRLVSSGYVQESENEKYKLTEKSRQMPVEQLRVELVNELKLI